MTKKNRWLISVDVSTVLWKTGRGEERSRTGRTDGGDRRSGGTVDEDEKDE